MKAQGAAQRRFHEGLCLAAGGQRDRAGEAFLECVLAEPGNAIFVEQLLVNLSERFSESDPPRGIASPEPSRASASGAETMESLLPALARQPWCLPTLVGLAETCRGEGWLLAAVCYWKRALKIAGDNPQVNRRGAELLTEAGELDEALACWRRVEAGEAADSVASEAIAQLIVARNRRRSRLMNPSDVGPPPLPPHHVPAGLIEFPVYPINPTIFGEANLHPPGLRLTPIQQLEAVIRERPSIAEPYLRLAQLYLEKDRDYDAERLLARGRDETDHDARVQRMWEDVAMLRLQKRVALAQEERNASDNPALQTAWAQSVKDRDKLEIEVFTARVKREPERAVHRYQLALRLKRADKLREACEQLEKALADVEYRCPAALEMARCLTQRGEPAPALRYYRMAAEAALLPSQAELQATALDEAESLARRMQLERLAARYRAERTQVKDSARAVLARS
jgi:hypothetical protein